MLGVPVRGVVVLGVLAAAGLMYVANGGERLGAEEKGTGKCRVTVVADILNVRSGPADTQPIVSTLRRDFVVEAEPRVENGFRLLSEGRWAKEEFVVPTRGSSCS